MNKRQRKKQTTKPEKLYKVPDGIYAKELLYKPITYDSSQNCDFESIMVPFLIKGNKLFLIEVMNSCSTSVYLTSMLLNEGRLSGYHDMSEDMKEALEVQETMGIEYYFGKLNKVYNKYMYILNILLNKGIIDKEQGKELIKNVDFDETRFDAAVASIETKLTAKAEEQKQAKSAADAILGFLGLLMDDEMMVEDDGDEEE